MAARNGLVPPDTWTGGENSWTREKLRTYQDWMKNPKGTDMHQDAGKRSKAESYVSDGASVDELYERMVARGIVARNTPDEAFRDAQVFGVGVMRVANPKKPAKRR